MSTPANPFTLASWSCPLSPPENKLPLAVHAGERAFR